MATRRAGAHYQLRHWVSAPWGSLSSLWPQSREDLRVCRLL